MNSDINSSNATKDSFNVSKEYTKGPFTAMSEKAMDTFDESVNAVKEQSEKIIESKKISAVHYLKDYAIAVQEAAVSLRELKHGEASPYLQRGADKLTQLAQLLQSKTVKSMADDVVTFARRNPGLFVTGSLLTGLAIARFAKSSSRKNVNSHYKSGNDQNSKQKTQVNSQVKSIAGALDSTTQRQAGSTQFTSGET